MSSKKIEALGGELLGDKEKNNYIYAVDNDYSLNVELMSKLYLFFFWII